MLPFWAAAGGLALVGKPGWAVLALVIGALILLFFRNPRRAFAGDLGLVLAAADGRITGIDTLEDPDVGPGRFHRVVTFLSPLDVHVQRCPAQGEVVVGRFKPGRKVAAFRRDAGAVNENHLTVLRRPDGELIAVRQIAGAVARRVVCYLRVGDRVERGQLMGLIKFGSRVDLLVPVSYRILVRQGDRLRTGETPVAEPGP